MWCAVPFGGWTRRARGAQQEAGVPCAVHRPLSVPSPVGASGPWIALGTARAQLLPARALWLPDHDALLVADLHWGKAAAFRAGGVPVPSGTTAEDLGRLSHALHGTGARQLVVLGDLWHAREGFHPDTLTTIAAWRDRHPALAITLVRGNHDRRAGDPPPALAIACHDPPLALGSLQLVHEPAEPQGPAAPYQVAGHLHPSVTLTGPGRERLRLPCFVVGARRALLPAFASFTGGGMHRPLPGDRHYAIAEGEVVAVD